MRWRVFLGLLVALVAPPIGAAEWSVETVQPAKASRFIFSSTSAADSTRTLDATACGTVVFGYRDDTLGADTAGSAEVLACERKGQSQGDCTVVKAFTDDSSFQSVNTRPGYFHVNVTGTPTAGAEAMIDAYCAADVGSSGGVGPETVVVEPGDTICGADCTDFTTIGCASGSAMSEASALSPSLTNPVRVLVTPGVYDECVEINNITDLTLEVAPGAVIYPTVATTSDVDGGVIRIGNDTTSVRNVERVKVLVNGLVQNDAFSGPEAAIQIGPEECAIAAGPNTPTWDNVTVEVNGRAVGHHDGVQWCGVGASAGSAAAITDLPVFNLTGSGSAISGRDACTKKGNSIDTITIAECLAWSNYCEDKDAVTSAFLAEQTGSVDAGTVNDFQLDAADAYGTDGGYALRRVLLEDNGGTCGAGNALDGVENVITAYDDTTRTATVFTAYATAPTTGCDYTISAVVNPEHSPCDSDWTRIFGSGADGTWKVTGLHLGISGPSTASPNDRLHMSGTLLRTIVNESVVKPGGCAQQTHIAGVLAYAGVADFGAVVLDQVPIDVLVTADQADAGACTDQIKGIALTAGSEVASFSHSGPIRVRNTGATEAGTRGVISNSTDANTVELAGNLIEVDLPGSYTGTSTTLLGTSPGTIRVAGDIGSPDLITVGGTDRVTGWDEQCFSVTDGAGTAFAQLFVPIQNSLVGVKLQAAACACKGTCGVANTLDLFDEAGNVIDADSGGGTELACTANAADMTWADISGDADGTLGNGDQPQVDEGATLSGTPGDDLVYCFRYTTNRWEN
jgi:hypothetical protein